MIKIELFSLPGITTYKDVKEAFLWCRDRLGDPGEGWTYGKCPGFLGSDMVSSVEEIEFLLFKHDEDAIAFKLRHS